MVKKKKEGVKPAKKKKTKKNKQDLSFRLREYDILESTSLKARELAALGECPWTAVVAKEQNLGYGRKGEKWVSPRGGLYFSLILPKEDIDDLQALTIFAAVSVAKIIKEKYKVEPFIKLPNDVFLNGKKICGILTENIIGSEVKSSVMGIGLNTNTVSFPKSLENKTTSLKIELNQNVDNLELLKQIILDLKKQLAVFSR